MALDPDDLEARARAEDLVDAVDQRSGIIGIGGATRLLVPAVIAAAVAAGAIFLWSSGLASTAGNELSAASTEFTAWAEEQVSATAATSPAEAVVMDEVEGSPAPRVALISGTDGSGVALRDRCAMDARSGGALSEGATVTILERGGERCAGWSLVEADGAITWVDDRYLAVSPAAEVAAN
jgi:membrane-bound ClpP family serine protease